MLHHVCTARAASTLLQPPPSQAHAEQGRDAKLRNAATRAGLVFCVVTERYLESEFGWNYMREAPAIIQKDLYYSQSEREGQEVVVLSQVLACDATLGYEDLECCKVRVRTSIASIVAAPEFLAPVGARECAPVPVQVSCAHYACAAG
jgi:hypothetical protein